MATKTFTKENAGEYEPQVRDCGTWQEVVWTCEAPNVWRDEFGGRFMDDEEILDLLRYVPNFTIYREVPDEPGEWKAYDIKRLANSDESADGLTSTVERVWLRKVKP
jgi:hypothetical protein